MAVGTYDAQRPVHYTYLGDGSWLNSISGRAVPHAFVTQYFRDLLRAELQKIRGDQNTGQEG